jgi:hypothetical protein
MDDTIADIDRHHRRYNERDDDNEDDFYAFAALAYDNWPAIRDRLREAERKAKAFDLVAEKRIRTRIAQHTEGWEARDFFELPVRWAFNDDLLPAIESALRGEEKPNA